MALWPCLNLDVLWLLSRHIFTSLYPIFIACLMIWLFCFASAALENAKILCACKLYHGRWLESFWRERAIGKPFKGEGGGEGFQYEKVFGGLRCSSWKARKRDWQPSLFTCPCPGWCCEHYEAFSEFTKDMDIYGSVIIRIRSETILLKEEQIWYQFVENSTK